MDRKKTVKIVIAACVLLALILLGVYFFALPQITIFKSSFESEINLSVYLDFASSGYRLKIRTLGSGILDSPESLESELESCTSDAMILSAGVAAFTRKTSFSRNYEGPVVYAVTPSDERNQYDGIFVYSALSGWDEVAGFLKKNNRKAVVVVTAETKGLEQFFQDPDFFSIVEYDGDSLRAPSMTLNEAEDFEADFICLPYVPNTADFLSRTTDAKWIADSSISGLIQTENLQGEIRDDYYASVKPLLKSGIRHTSALVLPLERRFFR